MTTKVEKSISVNVPVGYGLQQVDAFDSLNPPEYPMTTFIVATSVGLALAASAAVPAQAGDAGIRSSNIRW